MTDSESVTRYPMICQLHKRWLWFGLQGFIFKTTHTNHFSYVFTDLEVETQGCQVFITGLNIKHTEPCLGSNIDITIVNIFLNLTLLFRRGIKVISRHKSNNSSNGLKGKMRKTMMKNNHLDRSRNDNAEDVEELLPNFPKFQEVFLGEMVIFENHIIPRIAETSGQHMWL